MSQNEQLRTCFLSGSGLPGRPTSCQFLGSRLGIPDKECLSGYFSSQIQDGVTNLTCPSGDCDEPISQRDVELHVDDDDFSRFDRLQFQRTGISGYLDWPDDHYGLENPDIEHWIR